MEATRTIEKKFLHKEFLKEFQEVMAVFIGIDGHINASDLKRIIRRKPKRLFLVYPAGGTEELQMDYDSPWGFVSTLLARKGGEM